MGLWDVMVESWQEVCEEIDHPKLSKGSVLRVELTRLGIIGFDHYGIYAGNKKVIHFSQGKIRKEALEKFIEGAGILNGNYVEEMSFSSSATEHISLEESYRRAESCLGMGGYDVIDSNCEHFALWCRTGVAFSGQAFGTQSDRFILPNPTVSHFSEAVNIPRMIGVAFNRLGMKKARDVKISGIVDV